MLCSGIVKGLGLNLVSSFADVISSVHGTLPVGNSICSVNMNE